MSETQNRGELEEQACIVGVRFSHVGKIYKFDASKTPDLRVNDIVVVETSRGWQLGHVLQVEYEDNKTNRGKRKPIVRRATPRDLLIRQSWQSKENEVITYCRNKVSELGINHLKVVLAEYSFDGKRLTVVVSSNNEEKIDLKNLRQDLQKYFAPAQIEIRQIGPRDAAKMMCGIGACGLEERCCSKFLTEFCSISIRMAKEQEISLTPTEITGMCGRLRCCLNYEYGQYVEIKQELPKKNKRVLTPQGEGKVIELLTLKESVVVDVTDVGIKEFSKEEIKALEGSDTKKKG
jgi:cell fate regulator YaaT (PSP1 superfamily)